MGFGSDSCRPIERIRLSKRRVDGDTVMWLARLRFVRRIRRVQRPDSLLQQIPHSLPLNNAGGAFSDGMLRPFCYLAQLDAMLRSGPVNRDREFGQQATQCLADPADALVTGPDRWFAARFTGARGSLKIGASSNRMPRKRVRVRRASRWESEN